MSLSFFKKIIPAEDDEEVKFIWFTYQFTYHDISQMFLSKLLSIYLSHNILKEKLK